MSDLPKGFTLDPNLPSGFTLDGPPPNPTGASMVQGPSIGPGPRTSTMPDQPIPLRPWGEVALDFASNLPKSLWQDVAVPTYQAFHDKPLQTLESIPRMMAGALDNIPGPERSMSPQARAENDARYAANFSPEYRDYRAGSKAIGGAVIDDFAGYADLPTLQDRLANHPGRVAMDASTLLPALGPAGRVATSVIDPITAAGNMLRVPAKYVAEPVATNALSLTTGMSARNIRDIGSSGRALGSGLDLADGFIPKTGDVVANAAAVTDNMNRGAPVMDVVNRAKVALGTARQEAGAAYRAGMKDVGEIDKVIPFQPIDDALAKVDEVASFKPANASADTKGVELNPSAAETKNSIAAIVNDWKTLNPDSPLFKDVVNPADLTPENYHTAVGLDALKRRIGDLRDATDQGTPARVAADRVYNAIGAEIRKAAPSYDKVMADYQSAAGKLDETTRTFSLGERATGDTAARKLLSATNNNVQTNFGERVRLLDELAKHDSTLPYAIAGQSAQSLLPRGVVARGGALLGGGSALANPLSLAAAPLFSPRIVGNVVHYGGRVLGTVDDVAKAMRLTPDTLRALERGGYQAGRNDDTAQQALDLYRQKQAQGNPYLGGP